MKRSTHYLTQPRHLGRWHYSRAEHATLAGPLTTEWIKDAITLAVETPGTGHGHTYLAGRLKDAHRRGIYAIAHTARELGLMRNRRLAHYINKAVAADDAQADARVLAGIARAHADKARSGAPAAAAPAAAKLAQRCTTRSRRTALDLHRLEIEPIFGGHLLSIADIRTALVPLTLDEQARRNQQHALGQLQRVMNIIKDAR